MYIHVVNSTALYRLVGERLDARGRVVAFIAAGKWPGAVRREVVACLEGSAGVRDDQQFLNDTLKIPVTQGHAQGHAKL